MAKRFQNSTNGDDNGDAATITGRDWSDDSDRFPVDRALRAIGFKIAHRRPREEPRWEQGDVEFSQSEAEERLTSDMRVRLGLEPDCFGELAATA